MTVDDLLARLEEGQSQPAVEAIERWLTARDHDRLAELMLRRPGSRASDQRDALDRNAWRALRVLGGVPPRSPLDLGAAEAAIRRCAWFYFDAVDDWFIHEGPDLGVAALRPDRASLALVAGAATD